MCVFFNGCIDCTICQYRGIATSIFFLFILIGLGGSGASNGHNFLSMKYSTRVSMKFSTGGSLPHFTSAYCSSYYEKHL